MRAILLMPKKSKNERKRTSSSEKEMSFIKVNFMEVKDMREFLIGLMLMVVVAFVAGGTQATVEGAGESEVASETELVLTPEEFEQMRLVYFDRCAGCHGVLRKGATGPNLTPAKMVPKGKRKLTDMLWYGTAKGMPGWGQK